MHSEHSTFLIVVLTWLTTKYSDSLSQNPCNPQGIVSLKCQGFVLRKKKKILYVVLAKKKKTEVGTECLTDVNEVNMPGRFLAMR